MALCYTCRALCQVLDIEGARSHEGASIVQWPENGGANQLFRWEPRGEEGWGVLRSKLSGKVLDVSGGSIAAGAFLIQWRETDGDNQLFMFQSIEPHLPEAKALASLPLREAPDPEDPKPVV